MFFALVGLLSRRRGVVALYATIIVVGYALSLGPAAPGGSAAWRPFEWLATLPGVGGFRVPARFALLVLLGTSVLASLGIERALAWRQSMTRLALAIGLPVMLSEWYVVGFPGGKPKPFVTPYIYRVEALQSARALVSLPIYSRTPEWYREPDYQLFSTVHWRPIANGYGRAEPPGYARIVSHARAFPGPNNARTMRQLGIDYVVVHTDRFPDRFAKGIEYARQSPDYELAARIGPDYLFRVKPESGR
jgi:hypothetical protein